MDIVGLTTAAQPSGTAITVPVPAEAEPGDLLIVCHGDQSNVSTAYTGNTAFTRLTPWEANSSAGRVTAIWAKTHVAGDPTEFEFIRHGGATRSVAAMLAIRGYAEPYLDDVTDSFPGESITSGRRVESLTASGPGLQLFFARAEFVQGNSHVPTVAPAGFTELANWQTGAGTTASRSGGWLGVREVSAGPTPTADIVWGNPSAPSAQSVVIRALDAPAPAPAAEPVFYWWNGAEYVGLTMSIWDASRSSYHPVEEA